MNNEPLYTQPESDRMEDMPGVDQALTEIELDRSLKSAQEFMGPYQLATNITVAIEDTEYLKEMIRQMTNNLNAR